MRQARAGALILAVVVCCGCAKNPASTVNSDATVGAAAALDGRWIVTAREPDGTEISFRMTFAARGDRAWEGYSRAGQVREMINWRTAIAGALLRKLPPHGALVHLDRCVAIRQDDSILVTGTLTSSFSRPYTVVGTIRDGRLDATLRPTTNANGAAGRLTATPARDERALRDYGGLARDVERLSAAAIYDPAITRSSAWRDFFTALEHRFIGAHDDLDAIGAFYALQPSLRMSHWGFVRNPALAATPVETLVAGDTTINPDTLIHLSFPVPGVAWLRITKWEHVTAPVDRAFQRIDSARTHTLVLDIRNNGGGDATSMRVAAHLFRDTVPAGAFLGRRWYDQHGDVTTAVALQGAPLISTDSTVAQLVLGVRNDGARRGIVSPTAPRFDGSVYLLINHGTASASEPLAYLLQTSKRATTIGERTAGMMYSALPHSVDGEWVVIVPEANFFAEDGSRLEGRGVAPDIAASGVDAGTAVAMRVRRDRPYAGALLLGAVNEGAGRWPEAEDAYRDAARLAPDSLAPHKRLGAVLERRGRIADALTEFDAVLKLDPADAEALAARRRALAPPR